jgi:hypothetical protein
MIVIPASVGAEAGRKSNVGFVAPWMEGCGRPLSAEAVWKLGGFISVGRSFG